MNGHGGKRRNCARPVLTPAQVSDVRKLRAKRTPYKLIMRRFPVSRETLRRAVYGLDAYKGYAG